MFRTGKLTPGVVFRTGEIVLADPMYPDQKKSKKRPLLIISNDKFHYNTKYVMCLGITTNMKPDPYLVRLPKNSLEDGRLKYDSQVMCNRAAVILQYNLRKIARITPDFYIKVLQKLRNDVIAWTILNGGHE